MANTNQTQDLINSLIDFLRNYSYNGGYTTSYSTPTAYNSTPTNNGNYNIKDQKRRFKEELLHQDILDARQRSRFLEAYKKEKELHEFRLENLRIQLKEAEDAGDLKRRNELIHAIDMEERRFANATYGKNKVTETIKGIEKIVEGTKKVYGVVQKLTKPWADADHAASKFTKTIGGTKKAMDALTTDTLKGVSRGIGLKFDLSSQELIEAQQNYLKGIGRNINIDNVAKESMAAIARFSQDTGIDGLEMASQFENFGVNIEKTGDHLTEMFKDASKHGISFQSYSDNVAKNIKIAQNYTFKNGLKGLESMAKKATAIKLDMQQVANLADKVSTVEGAIETSAKLQVLGGPFASMADPMGMLYEGLNDMEGLQDRVIKMIRNIGHFDKLTGEIKVSSFEKQRIKAAAEAMGMDYSGLMESVNAQARREEINKQIKASGIAGNFDKDFQELIKNTATIKDGKAGITINGEFKALDQLDPKKDRETLIAMTRNESQDIKQIAIDLRSLVQKRSGLGKAYDAVQGRMFSWLGKGESGLLDMFKGGGFGNFLLGTGVVLSNIGIIGGLASLWSKRGILKGLGQMGTGAGAGVGAGAGAGAGVGAGAGAGAGAGVGAGAGAGVGAGASAGAGAGAGAMFAGGAVLTAVGAIGNYYTNKAVAEGKMKKGGTGHHVAKGASGALTGAGAGIMAAGGLTALGTMVPAIGTALAAAGPIGWILGGLGAAIGGGIGLYKASKAKNEKILDNQLKEKGISRKGDYGAIKLRKIDKALQTGEISDRLRRRLLQEGDTDILKAIESKKETLEKKELEKKKVKEKNRMNIGVANISIGMAKFNNMGQGLMGLGVNSFGIMGLATKGISSLIKGKEEKGTPSSFNKAKEKTMSNNDMKLPSQTFDININGTLRLASDNGQSIDLISELRKDPHLLSEVTRLIVNQMSSQNMGLQ